MTDFHSPRVWPCVFDDFWRPVGYEILTPLLHHYIRWIPPAYSLSSVSEDKPPYWTVLGFTHPPLYNKLGEE